MEFGQPGRPLLSPGIPEGVSEDVSPSKTVSRTTRTHRRSSGSSTSKAGRRSCISAASRASARSDCHNFGSRERIARMFGTSQDRLHEAYQARSRQPCRRGWPNSGPVTECVEEHEHRSRHAADAEALRDGQSEIHHQRHRSRRAPRNQAPAISAITAPMNHSKRAGDEPAIRATSVAAANMAKDAART